jgi:hypothetical protein
MDPARLDLSEYRGVNGSIGPTPNAKSIGMGLCFSAVPVSGPRVEMQHSTRKPIIFIATLGSRASSLEHSPKVMI